MHRLTESAGEVTHTLERLATGLGEGMAFATINLVVGALWIPLTLKLILSRTRRSNSRVHDR